jgi:hypothetical protein
MMFVATFIVAIGSMAGWAPFAHVAAPYTHKLFYLLIVQIGAIGVSMYKSIQLPRLNPILGYRIELSYRRYAKALKSSLADEQKRIWEQFHSGQLTRKLTRNEQAVIAEIKTAELNDGQHASGDAYLNFDSEKHWLEGSINYKFPHDNFFTHMPVTGRMLDGGNIHLQVSQPERPFWDGDEIRMRPAANYSIDLVRDTKDKAMFKGTVTYCPQQLDSQVEVADVVFIEIAN